LTTYSTRSLFAETKRQKSGFDQGGDLILGSAEKTLEHNTSLEGVELKRNSALVNALIQSLTRVMLKEAAFLAFRPSQNAAACLLAALNIATCPEICKEMDLQGLPSGSMPS